jgi:predicted O-linked N-acetylglucosamine transferase (SPINDLY family)
VIPESDRRFFLEKIVTMPHAYQVNDSRRAIAQTVPDRAGHGLPAEGFVFCNFNQSYKLTPDIFARWMRIMKAVPQSVLWLLEAGSVFAGNLRAEAERQGVSGQRLVFAPIIPIEDHLARLCLGDLFLDTLPYNAHTTASDALWAGLPLLTCEGTAFAGRVAASLLTVMGVPELVAGTLDEYERLALRLAHDPGLLASYREKILKNRLKTPLFDTGLYCRAIEKAYQVMWDRAGKAPCDFRVEGV